MTGPLPMGSAALTPSSAGLRLLAHGVRQIPYLL